MENRKEIEELYASQVEKVQSIYGKLGDVLAEFLIKLEPFDLSDQEEQSLMDAFVRDSLGIFMNTLGLGEG